MDYISDLLFVLLLTNCCASFDIAVSVGINASVLIPQKIQFMQTFKKLFFSIFRLKREEELINFIWTDVLLLNLDVGWNISQILWYEVYLVKSP